MHESLKEIVVADVAGARTITIARPEKKNALTVAMYAAMADAVESATDRMDVAAIVFAGEGGTFTAGNDLTDFVNNPPAGFGSPVFRFLHALARTPVPLIAAVDGAAIGIGTTMLLHCDFVYATPSARFVLPFVDLGLVPEAASSLLLPRAIGHLAAARMLYLGEPLAATAAHAAGLVTALVERSELDDAVRTTVTSLAAKPRTALLESKRLVKGDVEKLVARMEIEGAVFSKQLASPEAREAFAKFLGARPA